MSAAMVLCPSSPSSTCVSPTTTATTRSSLPGSRVCCARRSQNGSSTTILREKTNPYTTPSTSTVAVSLSPTSKKRWRPEEWDRKQPPQAQTRSETHVSTSSREHEATPESPSKRLCGGGVPQSPSSHSRLHPKAQHEMTSISGMGPPHPTSNDNTKPLPCLDHHPTRKSSKRVQFDLDRNHYYNNVHGITMEHKGQLWYSPSDFGHFATCLWHDQQAMLKWTTNTKGLSFPSNKEEEEEEEKQPQDTTTKLDVTTTTLTGSVVSFPPSLSTTRTTTVAANPGPISTEILPCQKLLAALYWDGRRGSVRRQQQVQERASLNACRGGFPSRERNTTTSDPYASRTIHHGKENASVTHDSMSNETAQPSLSLEQQQEHKSQCFQQLVEWYRQVPELVGLEFHALPRHCQVDLQSRQRAIRSAHGLFRRRPAVVNTNRNRGSMRTMGSHTTYLGRVAHKLSQPSLGWSQVIAQARAASALHETDTV